VNIYNFMDTEAGFALSMLVVGITLVSLEYLGMIACWIYRRFFARDDGYDDRD